MKTIVLITRENSERTTHVSVYLCSNYDEARLFCRFINNLALAEGGKLAARTIIANGEYSLGKYIPFTFDDFVKIDDRTIQRVLREVDSSTRAIALKNAKKEVKDHFFRNMLKRVECMLKEDMEYLDPITESDIERARQLILDIYEDLTGEDRFDDAFIRYKRGKGTKWDDTSNDRDHIVLVFSGSGIIAESVSIYLFDVDSSAESFCDYLNDIKQKEDRFIYARHIEQMVEYETVKPLLVAFDQVFEDSILYGSRYHYGESIRSIIIKDALERFSSNTLLQALKGLDKRSRMLIMRSLPIKTADEINEILYYPGKYSSFNYITLNDSRQAQQKILKAINKAADKFNKEHPSPELIRD